MVKYLECIRQDTTEFIEETDCDISSIWSAIVRGYEESPILNISRTNSSTEEIVNTLFDSSKRAYGAFLCTVELIVEICPRCASTIVQSLYKVFISPILIGHSNSTTFIFNLLQDYKMYFPYSYTFCRRIGRSPTTTLQQWREYFYPKQPSSQQQLDEVQDLSHDWDMSGLEEGEDSDGEDQKSILGLPTSVLNSPSMTKKRTTRMSTTHQRRGGTDQRQQLPNNSLSADLLVQMQSSGDGSLLEIQDMSFESPKSTRNSNPKASPVTTKNQQQRPSPSRAEKRDQNNMISIIETITIEDLRKAFSQGLEDDDSDLAERG